MVKPCENEECGKAFIAKRRDTRFCSASCRARAHTLKNRREHLLARSGAAARVEVVPPTTPATARLERRVRGVETALEAARVEAVRGLGDVYKRQGGGSGASLDGGLLASERTRELCSRGGQATTARRGR